MDVNVVKIRDDHQPLRFCQEGDSFKVCVDAEKPVKASWLPSTSDFSLADLRKGIEPWLASLFQSEHLSVLVGSGLTTAIQNICGVRPPSGMGVPTLTTEFKEQISCTAEKSTKATYRGKANIEDYIRVINELLVGLRILGSNADADNLQNELDKILKDFVYGISEGERGIAEADSGKQEEAFHKLVSFLMSFASRTGTRDRLSIFTTNYDRLIEAGAEIAGLHLIDRFVGMLSPIFRSSRLDIDMHYNPPGIRGEPRYLEGVARFTKLHGSIDWIESSNDIRRIGLPLGAVDIEAYLKAPGLSEASYNKVMIYPNASKDRETTEYPFVELFRDFAAAVCRPNSTLVTYGYSFGDDHINRIIRDMLTIPSTHLVIISYDGAEGRIDKFFTARPAQITLLVGSALADLQNLTEHYLPKPAIDKASIRMSELLKQRYSTNREESPSGNRISDKDGQESGDS
jgi:hypothetical protein